MKKRFIKPCLEFIRNNEKPVWVYLKIIRYINAWKIIQRCFCDFFTTVFMFARKCHNSFIWRFTFFKIFAESMIVMDSPFNTVAYYHCTGIPSDFMTGNDL